MPFSRLPLNKVRLTLLVAMFFTTLAAGIFRTPPILFMAGVLLAAYPLGALLGWLGGRGLTVKRLLPSGGMAGEIIEGEVTVFNGAHWPALLVNLNSGLEAVAVEVTVNSGNENNGAASGMPLLALNGLERTFPLLRPHESLTWRPRWQLCQRGVFEVGPARATAVDPLLLHNASRRPPKRRRAARNTPRRQPRGDMPKVELIVTPRPVRLDRLGILDGTAAGAALPRHAVVVADALDFHGVRPWLPGEGIRRVHWKSTARTQQLHVIEWEENVASDLCVLLDTQSAAIVGEAPDNTLETTITLVASIAAHLLESGYHFQFFCWQPNDEDMNTGANPGTGASFELLRHEANNLRQLNGVLEMLARVRPVANEAATLPALVEATQPHLAPGRNTLLLASSRAAVREALSQGDSRAIVLDADSFTPAEKARAASRATSHESLDEWLRQSPVVRVMRRGDAAASMLEPAL